MKIKYNIKKLGVIAAFVSFLIITSCSEDFPTNIDSPNAVVLKSIKILNAGDAGDEIIEGIVDESTKRISFPRLDPETDFSAIRFEAEVSSGAKLDKDFYNFPFQEGESEKALIIKVMNERRFREYIVTIRQRIPVFGADFSKPGIYDHTNNDLGSPIYPSFVTALTRGSGFDGNHVLIVTRHGNGSHLLNVSDLKNNLIKPIQLNLTGITLGTFVVNVGDVVNGHTYIANLSGATAGAPLKIYHWTDPSLAPEVIANINVGTIPGAGVRHGDNFSINLNEDGNGYIFLGDNAGTKVLRLKVTNYKTVSDPFVITSAVNVGSWSSFNLVPNSDSYLYTGHTAPIMVVNDNGNVAYTMGRNIPPIPLNGSDARVVNFNGERYLIMTTAARTGSESTVLQVYDITKGNNIVDAITNLEQERKLLYEYSLVGPVNTSPSSQTGFYIEKDDDGNDKSLRLYSAASDAGFVVIEFPAKQLED